MVKRILLKAIRLIRVVCCHVDLFLFMLPTRNKKKFDILIDGLFEVGVPHAMFFEYEFIRNKTLSYINSMKVGDEVCKYKFSSSQALDNIYSSVYACLCLDMYGEIENISECEKNKWVNYFDSFQSVEDGLWYDKILESECYANSDWWGARHLAIHIIAAYTALGAKPKYKINYVETYHDLEFTKDWLDTFDWNGFFDHSNDVDNKIMNIMVVLQYNRDCFNDTQSEVTLNYIYNYLDNKINIFTGMWGGGNINDPSQLSRAVQFSYHLFMPYFYDRKEIKYKDKVLELALKTQNRLGGFGVELNSSACEDIDSIELILNLGDKSDLNVQKALKKAFVWVLSNQNEDGGFVFRRNEAMWYGHEIMTANMNESHMLATWFRTLSLMRMVSFLEIKNSYKDLNIPGY